jgi:Spy/CpxP family protein refolding chaperone
LLFTAPFQACAQGQGQGGGGRGGFGVLTSEQRTQLRDAIQSSVQPLTEKLLEAQKDAAKAAMEGSDEATLRSKIEAVHKIQTDIAVARAKALKSINLTSDQKTQLEGMRDGGYNALIGGFGGFGGRGGGRRGGNTNNQ